MVLNEKKASIVFLTHNCSGVPKRSISDFINYTKFIQQE